MLGHVQSCWLYRRGDRHHILSLSFFMAVASLICSNAYQLLNNCIFVVVFRFKNTYVVLNPISWFIVVDRCSCHACTPLIALLN